MSEPEVRELLEAAERVFVERPDLLASFLDEFGELLRPQIRAADNPTFVNVT